MDSTLGRALGSPPDDLDLVELRPVLARDEQALGVRVVGDAVQHRFAAARALRVQRAEVDEPSTSPFAGEMRAMRSSYQMFAQISPSTYSSSFSFGDGDRRRRAPRSRA